MVTRLHRFPLNPDASFLIWRKDILVVAPLFTGVVQVVALLVGLLNDVTRSFQKYIYFPLGKPSS